MAAQNHAPGKYPDGYFHVELPSRRHRMDWDLWRHDIITKHNAGYPGDVIHHDNRAAISEFATVDPFQHEALVKLLGMG